MKQLRTPAPPVELVMGSTNDAKVMRGAYKVLADLGVDHDHLVLSAHRMPQDMLQYAEGAYERGVKVIIAGAGGSAHLPGMIAGSTIVPVLGVIIPSSSHVFNDFAAIGSMIAMPFGRPLATFGFGSRDEENASVRNAALFAAHMVAMHNETLATKLIERRNEETIAARNSSSN